MMARAFRQYQNKKGNTIQCKQLAVPLFLVAALLCHSGSVRAEESVQRYERKSITYFQVDVEKAPVPVRDKAMAAMRGAVELNRFDVNDLGFLGDVSLKQVGFMVQKYVDRNKIKQAREQAEYDLRFKDEIITAEMLQRIMDSAFLYRGKISSWKTISGKSSLLFGIDIPAIETVIEAEVEFWKVAADGTVEAVTTVTAIGAGYGLQLARSRSAAEASSRKMAMYWLRRNLAVAVRNIPQFSLKVNISNAGANSVWLDLTAEDGLETDALFKVKEKTSKGIEDVGWIKIRKVADGKKEFNSRAQIIAVRKGLTFGGGELIEEYAQSGVEFGGAGGTWLPDIQGGGYLKSASAGGYVSARVSWDLGPTLNIPEIWVGAMLNLWMPLPHFEINLEPAIAYRFYLRRTVIGLGLAAGAYRAWLPSLSSLTTYVTHGVGVRPFADVGIWFSPKFQMYVEGGYRLYADLSASGYLTDSDGDSVPAAGFRYNSSGLMFGLGLRFIR